MGLGDAVLSARVPVRRPLLHALQRQCVWPLRIRRGPAREVTMSSTERDYDRELKETPDHKYAYTFDLDVMHPLMLRSFEPFIHGGEVLELGSYTGEFTARLATRFNDITCVEASGEAVKTARARIADKARIIQSTFESVTLDRRFEHIVLTHVLEHLDDPVGVLKRVNEEWLSETGRLFLACPNGNAASRQIAVHMGLISQIGR